MRRYSLKLILLVVCLIAACGLSFYVFHKRPMSSDAYLSKVKPAAPSLSSKTGLYHKTFTLAQGDTFTHVLDHLGIPLAQAQNATAALSEIFNPKDLRIDQEIHAVIEDNPTGAGYTLKSLSFQPDFDYEVKLVSKGDDVFGAEKVKKKLKHDYSSISGAIQISLYADALRAGASPKMLYDMIKAFSYDVDFQRDIQPGTEFSLFYDTYKDEASGLERPGELLYAKLVLEDKPHEIYYFQPKGGTPGYYTAHGEGIKKALLRTPIDGARLTSGFGYRKHPIQGYTKMHKGVDFAAPCGTPIMAAGDGVIERSSSYRGYGNYICIRHGTTTKTAYAHLSRYATGIKPGKKVSQGQVIGYVGRTGHATGPHLHFELIQNGKHINPNKITQLPTSKLAGKLLKDFRFFVAKIEKMIKDKEKKLRQMGV